MSINIHNSPEFDAAHLTHFLCLECSELVRRYYDEERSEICIDEALYDVVQGLRVKIEGHWYRIAVTSLPIDPPTQKEETNG